ncbi:MAG: DUF1015 domain-containing protein [Lachnospiraceae bacterium]|nr:DUF1015 domain-containing protein [Candidatus Merdinaster equi]
MSDIRPFRAIRPAKGYEDRIAALPYDVYSSAEAREVVKGKPDSFLNIDRPETAFPVEQDMYAPEVYAHAKKTLDSMIADGRFVQDEKPYYYLYSLTMDGRKQTGFVAAASIWDYKNGIIKKHENTRADKEEDRIRHVDTCDAQTGPIFLAYRDEDVLSGIMNKYLTNIKPDYDFVSEDGIGHTGWIISDDEDITKISKSFSEMNEIYIADGHHRCASACKVGLKRAQENPNHTGNEEYNHFLCVLFPENQLKIMDYNRVVKDLNGLSSDEYLKKISEKFSVKEEACQVKPAKQNEFGMNLQGKWYKLEYLGDKTGDPVKDLDVSILQDNLLGPILGIGDPKTDKRIDFVGGIRGLSELDRRVKEGCAVAFSMYPTSITELFDVADAGLLMPPKSTWFEPKLRSGLYIHHLSR